MSILNGTNQSLTTDLALEDQISIYCAVERGRPEPNIYWALIDSNMNLANSNSRMNTLRQLRIDNQKNVFYELNSSKIESPKSHFYFSWLKANASIALLNKTLACIVEHDMLEEPLVKSLRINLKCMELEQ